MDYHFKEFTGRNTRQENRLTITRSCSIGLPTKFFNDNKIENYKYAVLFYDEEKKAIGILFTSDESKENKFSIIRNKTGFGGGITVRSFFKSYNIDPAIYFGRYDYQKINLEGVGEIFVINLKENQKSIPTTNAISST